MSQEQGAQAGRQANNRSQAGSLEGGVTVSFRDEACGDCNANDRDDQ